MALLLSGLRLDQPELLHRRQSVTLPQHPRHSTRQARSRDVQLRLGVAGERSHQCPGDLLARIALDLPSDAAAGTVWLVHGRIELPSWGLGLRSIRRWLPRRSPTLPPKSGDGSACQCRGDFVDRHEYEQRAVLSGDPGEHGSAGRSCYRSAVAQKPGAGDEAVRQDPFSLVGAAAVRGFWISILMLASCMAAQSPSFGDWADFRPHVAPS